MAFLGNQLFSLLTRLRHLMSHVEWTLSIFHSPFVDTYHEIIRRYQNDMARMNSYVIAEIMPLNDGNWSVGLRHSGLRQEEASELAANLSIRPNTALFVGSPCTRAVHLYSPHAQKMAINGHAEFPRGLHKWINWLRELGILRLEALGTDGIVQFIPAAYALGMTLPNPLQKPMLVPPYGCNMSVNGAEAYFKCAPVSSIAGLMRTHALKDEFIHWLNALPRSHWLNFKVPMHEKTPSLLLEGARIEVNLWIDSAESIWPVIGHMRQLRIGLDETICVQDYPIDRFGLAWSSGGERRQAIFLDSAYRTNQDQRLDKAFDGVSLAISSVMAEIVRRSIIDESSRVGSIAIGEQAKRWETVVIAAMQPDVDALRREVLKSIYPYDGRLHSPAVVNYLIAPDATQLRQRRMQAQNAFPAVVNAIASGLLPQTSIAVDAARPSLRAVAEEMNVPLWVARRACKLRYSNEEWSDERIPTLEELVLAIGALGPNCPACDEVMLRKLVDLRRDLFAFRESHKGERLTRRLFAAIGRSAEVGGWESAAASVSRLFNSDDIFTIEDYWHVAESTVAIALQARRTKLPEQDFNKTINQIVDVWLSTQSLQELLERSERWMRMKWDMSQNFVEKRLQEKLLASPMTPLFESLCWTETGVEIEVLTCKERLIAESGEMHHCVASYWTAVATYRVLVVSLVQFDSGLRATLALNVNRQGEWCIRELKGVSNVAIDKDSVLVRTVIGLLHWLTEPAPEINRSVLQKYLDRSGSFGPLVNGYQITAESIQALPETDQELAATCFPGAGPINKRIAHILAKLKLDGQSAVQEL